MVAVLFKLCKYTEDLKNGFKNVKMRPKSLLQSRVFGREVSNSAQEKETSLSLHSFEVTGNGVISF